MEKHQFIDKYFHSQYELLDFRKTDERDINTLYTFLNNLHTTADRLKKDFDCDIKSCPDFKLLRLIRNYFHHVGDVEEIRLPVFIKSNILVSHTEHLLIPLETVAKSIKLFIDNNTLPEHHKNQKRKKAFIEKEMDSIAETFDSMKDMLSNLDAFCTKPSLKLDGVIYELGFDMYNYVYNITNIIADRCKELNELKNKTVINSLDESHTAKNNIGKHDVFCHANCDPIITTEGFIYPKKIETAM